MQAKLGARPDRLWEVPASCPPVWCPDGVSRGAMAEVRTAWFEAVECGWAVLGVGVDEVAAAVQGCATVVPTRAGDAPVGRLRSAPAETVSRPSFSRMFGLGQFPLHTDGAHLRLPPDAVFLEFDRDTGAAPTLVHRLVSERVEEPMRSALSHGIFEIGFGRSAFLGVIATPGGVRFDPVAMRPRDQLAALATEYLRECLERSKSVPLPGPGTTLVLDNRRTLHGRAPVAAAEPREGRRLMLRWRS